MSITIMNAVWQHSASQGRARLVLLAIADHQGEIGAWPSIATLARMVNASERSVQRDIQELQELGELIVEVQAAPSRGQYKSNLYWVQLPGVTENASGVTDLTSGVTESASGVTTGGVLTLIEPLQKPNINISSFDSFSEKSAFDFFWEIYPRKVGKGSAKRAFWKAVSNELSTVIIDGARRLANDPNLPPMEFIKHPTTWLNSEGWNDQPYPPRQRTAEELAEQARIKREREREASLKATAEILAESERSKANATTTVPKCEHGNSIARCIRCLNKKS